FQHDVALVHGDLRIDNILFAPDGNACWLVDWQTLGRGSGAADLAYLVGTSIADPLERAAADRPAFDAKGGYAGSQFLMSVSKRYPKYWLGAFARWDSLKGAVFADSPLVKREDYFAAGVGIAWILGESATRVEAIE
ncbi:MAG: MipA/OmpV family protein, partial [Thiobacillus sp.]|nr:MipA/OmpV family protein [Thiobacillus sp.]